MTSADGSKRVPALYLAAGSHEKVVKLMKDYIWRDGDFILATYAKTVCYHYMSNHSPVYLGSSWMGAMSKSREVCKVGI